MLGLSPRHERPSAAEAERADVLRAAPDEALLREEEILRNMAEMPRLPCIYKLIYYALNLVCFSLDALLSAGFWCAIIFLPGVVTGTCLLAICILAVLWRTCCGGERRDDSAAADADAGRAASSSADARPPASSDAGATSSSADARPPATSNRVSTVSPVAGLPYTCAFVASGPRTLRKELYIVASLHISPRAPLDVAEVIGKVRPDVVMIELDEERSDGITAAPARQVQLQPVDVSVGAGATEWTLLAQRAIWNAEFACEAVSGRVVFDEDDPYGVGCSASGEAAVDLESRRRARAVGPGDLVLCRRGAPAGASASLALKAHTAARRGASGVLVINSNGPVPNFRVGSGSLLDELRTFRRTRSCGFPPIPLLMLAREDGERLLEQACREAPESQEVRGSFRVLNDDYPRRTLRRRLCQSCALAASGIGVLYGIVECFRVDVGGEFDRAEQEARALGVPCLCIDVDLDRLCSRVGAAILPTPRNIANAVWTWAAAPRYLLGLLFPGEGTLDVLGVGLLHAMSFRARTWAAFLLAGLCASALALGLLWLVGWGAAEGAVGGAGVVPAADEQAVQTYVVLGLELYLAAQLYKSVAVGRDEAMYKSIVARAREVDTRELPSWTCTPQRIVVVVGAAHVNGILEHAKMQGLGF
eukprot:TRINITY_DN20859_c0_g1_i1.p1 TRINITY_DN20859_c0_g1~~TRINITY_DN20859_c0_g1_i1.p1  ORF type:complete len:682 (-),score=119.42 TRINITY_DN20859_c0_g1_i1:177-2123(-)